ncbi:MAG: bifunctional histidinol-phosphatase/imidazoleglycerol-phosphate dehydratase HisB [Chitinophagaceae bacterium]
MKKVLFIDRDGTLIKEAPPTYQIDSFEKLEFVPGVFAWLGKIAREMNYELVMVTNQDGLGTESFSEYDFWPVQNFIIKSLENEGIRFTNILIDRSIPEENKNTRKPGTGMLTKFMDNQEYDLLNSFVIGDRDSDVALAGNLGCKAFRIDEENGWEKIYLRLKERKIKHDRSTNETKISIELNLEGSGELVINTGLDFFNHLLQQLGKHSGIDLSIIVDGDLHIDEHHTIEDTAIALGESFALALGTKRGIERYGFCLPMDDCLAQVAIDFGGRSWLVWNAEFKREKIGDLPTEMFYHFFKSFADGAKCNMNIKVEGENEHHKIESIFKALARAIKMAVKRDVNNLQLPTTKGML